MNFLVDENLPFELCKHSLEKDHSSVWVRDISPGASDPETFNIISDNQQTLVTRDKRFANFVLFQLMKDKVAEGVVLIREEKLSAIIAIWESYLLIPPPTNSFVILTQNKIRIRKL